MEGACVHLSVDARLVQCYTIQSISDRRLVFSIIVIVHQRCRELAIKMESAWNNSLNCHNLSLCLPPPARSNEPNTICLAISINTKCIFQRKQTQRPSQAQQQVCDHSAVTAKTRQEQRVCFQNSRLISSLH